MTSTHYSSFSSLHGRHSAASLCRLFLALVFFAGGGVAFPAPFIFTDAVTLLPGSGMQVYEVDVPPGQPGWRLVLSHTGAGNPDLYVKRGSAPTTTSSDKSSVGQLVDTIVFTDVELTAGKYYVGVNLPGSAAGPCDLTLTTEAGFLTQLAWDPGATHAGTISQAQPSLVGGDYYFKITTANTTAGAWRTALNVSSGEADVFLRKGPTFLPGTNNYAVRRSQRIGSDGFVLRQGTAADEFAAAQDWFLLVRAAPGSTWSLVTGEAFVQALPPLAPDAASSPGPLAMGAEGMRYFRTSVSPGTLAWRLGLNGGGNKLLVAKARVPFPDNTANHDLQQLGQMLVVPPYLVLGDSYLVGVVGDPGTVIDLDSRQQAVTPLAFPGVLPVSVAAGAYGYVTFRVDVPVDAIAWQVKVAPTLGNANVALRRDNVANEFRNDGYSEVAGAADDSVTLVPNALTDGTFYVTVYGSGPYAATLTSGEPAIADVPYAFVAANPLPALAGWQYFRVTDIPAQLGSLGWELNLSGQVPGTEIALRRNAVPSEWRKRNSTQNQVTFVTDSRSDYSSTNGFLQRPGHQADIWYIGVYMPTAPLGAFTLTGTPVPAPLAAFDGSSTVVAGLAPGRFQWHRIDVPSGPLGWDVRLTAAGPDVKLVLRRDSLPGPALNSHANNPSAVWTPNVSTNWPNGYQWAAALDWTRLPDESTGLPGDNRILATGMGNPLEPGTYYVGVFNGGTTAQGYTLLSRGIGPGLSLPVAPLAFAGGVSSKVGLAARQADYFAVVVPPGMDSWKLRLHLDAGQARLALQGFTVPNILAVPSAGVVATPPANRTGGALVTKTGDEEFVLLPRAGQAALDPGTYYLAVVSEGVTPTASRVGAGACSYTLTSFGALPAPVIAIAPGAVVTLPQSLVGGEVKGFKISVGPGTLGYEIALTGVSASAPTLTLRPDGAWPMFNQSDESYGIEGGQSSGWSDHQKITVANPASALYSLLVHAGHTGTTFPATTFNLRVQALDATPLPFDGGTAVVAAQENESWRYFSVVVPPGALGWDVRLTSVTSGSPQMVVRRATAPDRFGSFTNNNPSLWSLATATAWTTNGQYTPGHDWLDVAQNADGASSDGRVFACGMGNPLEPGEYIVGVRSAASSTAPVGYTIVSRGIGPGLTIPVAPVAFAGGAAAIAPLPARELAYFSVVVPPGAASWQFNVTTNSGDVTVAVQKDALPNIEAGATAPTRLGGGRRLQKRGAEQYALLAEAGTAAIPAGTYYVAVIGEGSRTNASRVGAGTSDGTFTSAGVVPVTAMGVSSPVPLLQPDTVVGGALKGYQFTVPPGAASLEVKLLSPTGLPRFSVTTNVLLPETEAIGQNGVYGYDGGQPNVAMAEGTQTITLANPVAGTYSVTVRAKDRAPGDGVYTTTFSDASYTLSVTASGPAPLAFDGGTSVVTGQAADTWKFFSVVVPPGVDGWDIRLSDVASGTPQLVVRRDLLPDSLATHGANAFQGWAPENSTIWPSGFQHAAGSDWTHYTRDERGTNVTGRIIACGMGNPLEPGLYLVGVRGGGSSTTPLNYTILSRGIGAGLAIPVTVIGPPAFSVTSTLTVREAAYFKVTAGAISSLETHLKNLAGDNLLVLQRGFLPHINAGVASPLLTRGGHRLSKLGDEHSLVAPDAPPGLFPPATYFFAVVSEGLSPNANQDRSGGGNTEFTLKLSSTFTATILPGPFAVPVSTSVALEGGTMAAYFVQLFPSGPTALEVRLDNVVGIPQLALAEGEYLPRPFFNTAIYGFDLGVQPQYVASDIITVPNATAPIWAVNVHSTKAHSALSDNGGSLPGSSGSLVVTVKTPPPLSIDPSCNAPGLANVATGLLRTDQRDYFRVDVPAVNCNGDPVIGWRLTLAEAQGAALVRVRKESLPEDTVGSFNGTSPFVSSEGIFVAPYLTPGTWFVEVKGTGITDYTLTSEVLTTERLWQMPDQAGLPAPVGLTLPEFGDSGVTAAGVPLPGDGGTDLAQGRWHFYAVEIPTNNVGLLRTRLDAISGNPNLYIRFCAPPTLSHAPDGNGGTSYDRSLSASGRSEYGNWVPLGSATATVLPPGTNYVAVQAGGASNVRYRLHLGVGQIDSLPFTGGALVSQNLAGGDWRYYRVAVPDPAPTTWSVTFQESLGDVTLHVREGVPPGSGLGSEERLSVDWADDAQEPGLHPAFDAPGTITLTTPPLHPGRTYYLGFRAKLDSTFSVSTLAGAAFPPLAGSIAFAGGTAAGVVPAAGAVFYKVSAPSDAARWIHLSTHVAGVHVNIHEGTLPAGTSGDAYQSSGANSSLNRTMGANVSHWRPGQNYYLAVFNTTAAAQPYSIALNGLTATTDADADGLPDAWELIVFNNLTAATATSDADQDGLLDLDEFVLGTSPRNAGTPGILGPPNIVVGGFVELSFQGEVGQEYELQRSAVLPIWTPLVRFTATGQQQFLHDFAPPPAGLSVYRTVLIPNAARARCITP